MKQISERQVIIRFLNWATPKHINLCDDENGYPYQLRPSRIDKLIRTYLEEKETPS